MTIRLRTTHNTHVHHKWKWFFFFFESTRQKYFDEREIERRI